MGTRQRNLPTACGMERTQDVYKVHHMAREAEQARGHMQGDGKDEPETTADGTAIAPLTPRIPPTQHSRVQDPRKDGARDREKTGINCGPSREPATYTCKQVYESK